MGPAQRSRLRAEVEGKRKKKKKEVEGRGSPAVEGVHGAGRPPWTRRKPRSCQIPRARGRHKTTPDP